MGARHSLQDDVTEFVKTLRGLHAVRCCMLGWAETVESVAAGRIRLDLDDRAREYIEVAGALPRLRAGEVGIMVKDHVRELRQLVEGLREPAQRIVDIHSSMQRAADAVRGARDLKESPLGGGVTERQNAIARVLECAPAECNADTLTGMEALINQAFAAMKILQANRKDPHGTVFEIQYRADTTMTNQHLKDTASDLADRLEEIARETTEILHKHRAHRVRMLGSVRRMFEGAMKMRREVAIEFGEVIMAATKPTKAK